MTRFNANQTSFNAGVLAGSLRGNTGIERYANGLDLAENFIPLKQGGITKRPGTKYISDAGQSESRIEIFEYNGQTICMEFFDNTIRFYEDGARVESPPGTPVEVSTSYSGTDINELDIAQNLDKVYIAHRDHAFAILTFTSSTSWSLDDAVFVDGPYLDTVEGDTEFPNPKPIFQFVGSSDNVGATITINAVNHAPFVATDVGRVLRTTGDLECKDWNAFRITAFSSTSSITAEVLKAGDATDQKCWQWGAYSDTTGHPSTVTFHHARLILGGADPTKTGEDDKKFNVAQYIFGSRTNKFLDFTPTQDDTGEPLDDDSYRYKIASDKSNEVLWVRSAQRLFVGTPDSEYAITASNDGPITPNDVLSSRVSRHGSTRTKRPLVASNGILFPQRSGRKIRSLDFDIARDGFTAPDISQLSEDLVSAGVKEMDYQQEPYTLVWSPLDNGGLTTITYDPLENVIAFANQPIAGTNRLVHSVASGQSRISNRDELYLVVQRDIDGSPETYIEYLNTEFSLEADQEDAYFVDSGVTYDGAPTTTITGLDHLEGETVSILADGAVRPPLVVSSGEITLSSTASKVHVGLGYTSKLKTLPPEIGLPDGSAQVRKSRHFAVGVRVQRSLGFKVGPDESNLETVTVRRSSDPMSAPVPLFTGVKEAKNLGRWVREDGVMIFSDQPTPLTVLSVSRRLHVNSA